MSYVHNIEACFEGAVGVHGLPERAFAETLAEVAPAVKTLRARHADGSMPLLRLPAMREDMGVLMPVAERFRETFEAVVVLGTGGSSLGAQAVTALAGDDGPALFFPDNIDPDSFETLLAGLDPRYTGVLAVSKSGGTAETLVQTLAMRHWLMHAGSEPARHMVAVVQPGDSPLRRLAEREGLTVVDHDPELGGRFSVLSPVGLLPAAIAGQEWEAIRAGADETLRTTLDADDPAASPPAIGAAINVALSRLRDINQTVLLVYSDLLDPFAQWFRQLWAESLGKSGHGTTPIPARGAVDQHSQLQLYLDGPADKLFTVVTADRRGKGPRVPAAVAEEDEALALYAGRTMGDLMEVEQRATIETLARNGRPVRTVGLTRLDEHVLGALMMHFMLETIFAAHLFAVDPFDQPAVEEGKVLARKYLDALPKK